MLFLSGSRFLRFPGQRPELGACQIRVRSQQDSRRVTSQMNAVNMIFPYPETHSFQNKLRHFPSGEIKLRHHLQTGLVKLTNHIFEFCHRICTRIRIGRLWRKHAGLGVAPVIQTARRFTRSIGIALYILRHHDFLKFHRRQKLQGSDSQLFEVRNLVHHSPEGSPVFCPRRRMLCQPPHMSPVHNAILIWNMKRPVPLPVKFRLRHR